MTGRFDERSIIAEGLFYLAGFFDDKGFHDELVFRGLAHFDFTSYYRAALAN
jgi:hypothetical protein